MGKLIENIRKFLNPDPSEHEIRVSELGRESFFVTDQCIRDGIVTRNITKVIIHASDGTYNLSDEFISGPAPIGIFMTYMGSKGTYGQNDINPSVANQLIRIARKKAASSIYNTL